MDKLSQYRSDFPILQRKIHGDKRLVYLDNAATSQKPSAVIDAISNYYRNSNANVHRGIHQLGDESTRIFHDSRKHIAEFFGATAEELVVVRNTTEAVNQVAYTWGEANVQKGDVILLTEMEHHSNVVPWQELARRRGADVVFVEVQSNGRLNLNDLEQKLTQHGSHVKLVSFVHVSNTLGTTNPVEKIVAAVRTAEKKLGHEIKIFVDGAQAAAHLPVNFSKMDVEFYAVSAHKMLGPMGIGGLLVRRSVLQQLQPFLFGGGMINEVLTTGSTFAEDFEDRFTAGTPDVASLVGWATACQYLQKIGMDTLVEHDQDLVEYTLKKLREFPQIEVIGPRDYAPQERVGSVAFIYKGVHAHDVGQILDSEGVAVRSGHHCTMPLHVKFGWQASVRVSFQLYNTHEDIDAFIAALQKVQKVFGK